MTGGFKLLKSTEILVSGAGAWVQVSDLPTVTMEGLRGVSFNNEIIMTGNSVTMKLCLMLCYY